MFLNDYKTLWDIFPTKMCYAGVDGIWYSSLENIIIIIIIFT
jgi:hypothetical protein